ncbi:bifunctional diguanylate cyclase/phosphodiesterase [Glaciecola sp. KUL10]|uniref:putative bifunctional diguanylate cyclase/phosphodiesterase n=1 Tax=Glaciecola sp. (strain KUL10) TaxID=2161813 RepID=UPI0011B76048|nr:bifunctional diguanylate cyclase/phosphodiesterase [Glaciecola sp. KUL10]
MNILCAVAAFTSGFANKQKHFKAIFVACVLTIVYQYSTWEYHQQADVASSLYWLKIQSTATILSIPLYYFIFIQWSGYKFRRRFFATIALFGLLFALINLASQSTIRYQGGADTITIISYQLLTGEQVYRASGIPSMIAALFYPYVLIVFAVLAWVAARLVKEKKYWIASTLLVCLFLQVTAAVGARLVDMGVSNLIYFGGLPFTTVNFMSCIWLVLSHGTQSRSLTKEISLRKQLEQAMESLVKGNASNNSDDFYFEMLSELQRISNAKCAYIGFLNEENQPTTFESKVFLFEGQRRENISFSLNQIDDELITYDKMLVIKKNLEKFGKNELFEKLSAKAMINCPMNNDTGQLEGSIVLIYDRILDLPDSFYNTVELFASRSAVEIKRDRLERELHQMAYFDYKTKLPNLMYLHQQINESFDTNIQNGTQSALLIVDLNKFAEINRQFGFNMGEKALYEVAARLKNYQTPDISVNRIGGDEFSVLINTITDDPQGIVQLHWEAINALVEKPIIDGHNSMKLSCSGGAVIFPLQVEQKPEILRCAEIALEQAKQAKRNDMRLFDEEILHEIDRQSRLVSLLKLALIDQKELFPVFQPKVDANGNLIGAEALARWVSSEIGFVSPQEFVSAAENSGFIGQLGFWMVEAVCKQINHWQAMGIEFKGRIAINFSAFQLIEEDFVEKLVQLVEEHHVQPTQIELELTESGLLTNMGDCVKKLERLRKLGFTVALDDFGTGYSSLSYLKDLPLDVLKIDRSFVNSLDAQNTTELARSIISIGQHMSLSIVAEGVEDVQQVNTLSQMGCKIFQGYYFAKPMTADDFFTWAASHTHESTTRLAHNS